MYWWILWVDKIGSVRPVGPYKGEREAEEAAALREYLHPDLYPIIRASYSRDPNIVMEEWDAEQLGGLKGEY